MSNRSFLFPILTIANTQIHDYHLEVYITDAGNISISGHCGNRPKFLVPSVYYQCCASWTL